MADSSLFEDHSVDDESFTGSNSESEGIPSSEEGEIDQDVSLHQVGEIQPYDFEPEAEDTDEVEHDQLDLEGRVGRDDWCSCGHCVPMERAYESLCCSEIPEIQQKIAQLPEPVGCILDHPGFDPLCLNVFVLETAYYAYKQQYGPLQVNLNKKYRYTAYRQLVRWCWGILGKKIRVLLPSCCYHKIRETFGLGPGEVHVGFKPVL